MDAVAYSKSDVELRYYVGDPGTNGYPVCVDGSIVPFLADAATLNDAEKLCERLNDYEQARTNTIHSIKEALEWARS